jgi:methyl-accepting chemotaxis protein
MAAKYEENKRSKFSWFTIARVGITAAFFFWIYLIWNITTELNAKLNVATDRYLAIQNLQIEYKNEVQEWKNLLLRSTDRESFNKNWLTYDTQYQKVSKAADEIIRQNDVRAISERMKTFVATHAENYAQYKKSTELFIGRGFDPRAADAAVRGIDRPLLDTLEAADAAMQDERKNINERLTAQSRSQIEQSLIALGFIALLVVWMPK